VYYIYPLLSDKRYILLEKAFFSCYHQSGEGFLAVKYILHHHENDGINLFLSLKRKRGDQYPGIQINTPISI